MHTTPFHSEDVIQQFLGTQDVQASLLDSLLLLSAHYPQIVPLLTFMINGNILTVSTIPRSMETLGQLSEEDFIRYVLENTKTIGGEATLDALHTELNKLIPQLKILKKDIDVQRFENDCMSINLTYAKLFERFNALTPEEQKNSDNDVVTEYNEMKLKKAELEKTIQDITRQNIDTASDYLNPIDMIITARAYLRTQYSDTSTLIECLGQHLRNNQTEEKFKACNLMDILCESDLLLSAIYQADATSYDRDNTTFDKLLCGMFYSAPEIYQQLAENPAVITTLDEIVLANLFNGFKPRLLTCYILNTMITMERMSRSTESHNYIPNYRDRLYQFSCIVLAHYTSLEHGAYDEHLEMYRAYIEGRSDKRCLNFFIEKCLNVPERAAAEQAHIDLHNKKQPGRMRVFLFGPREVTTEDLNNTIDFIRPQGSRNADIFTVLQNTSCPTYDDDLHPNLGEDNIQTINNITDQYRDMWRTIVPILYENKHLTQVKPPKEKDEPCISHARKVFLNLFTTEISSLTTKINILKESIRQKTAQMTQNSKVIMNAHTEKLQETEMLRKKLIDVECVLATTTSTANNALTRLTTAEGEIGAYQKRTQNYESQINELTGIIHQDEKTILTLREELKTLNINSRKIEASSTVALACANQKIEQKDVELIHLRNEITTLKEHIATVNGHISSSEKFFNLIAENFGDEAGSILSLLAEIGALDSKFFEEDEELTPTTPTTSP